MENHPQHHMYSDRLYKTWLLFICINCNTTYRYTSNSSYVYSTSVDMASTESGHLVVCIVTLKREYVHRICNSCTPLLVGTWEMY